MRKWFVILASASLAVLLAVLVGSMLRSSCWSNGAVCPGTRLGGLPLSQGADPDAWLGQRASELAAREVEISVEGVPDAHRTLTLGELGVVLDVSRMASLVHAIGHSGGLLRRIEEARRAARGEIELPLVVHVDDDMARAALSPLKEAADELPVPARLDLVHGGIIPELPGRFVDLGAAEEALRTAALGDASAIELRRIEIAPRISRDFLAGVDASELLARFQTSFARHGEQGTRAHNIETAAARLDGVVLLPHEVFSFNAIVGPRTVENGFSKGWEIFKGEMVEGIGGGTCQAASTLHAAALLAGLDIIERLPHSRPSAYITMGLDATVVYPIVDLKLRNPYDFPIVIHSYVEGDTVFFEMRGHERPVHVTFGREVLAVRPYTRKVEEKPGLPADRIVRKQHGIRGYKIRRTRTIAYGDGTARKESNIDVYWPTIELYQVAPGTDAEGLLPPPGEGFDEAGSTGWSPPPDAAPAATPTPVVLAAAPVSPVTLGAAEPAPSNKAILVEAPGVHPPRAEQLRVPKKVVIGSAPSRP